MPVWVSRELTLAIHQRQLAEHGGLEGVRDEGALESALARPQNLATYSTAEPDIARNHPFSDGNTRTAYVVCRLFSILNGWDFTVSREERYTTFLALAAGEISEEELTSWLRENVRPKAPYDAGT